MNNDHSKNFWFCCFAFAAGLLFLAALIWLPVPKANESMANIAIGFITGTVIFIPISYLLGGNIPQAKKPDASAGTTTADISASITTAPKEEQ